MDSSDGLDRCCSLNRPSSEYQDDFTISTTVKMDPSVQIESKSATREQEDLSITSVVPVSLSRNVDPDLALAIAQITPERRVEIEKRLKLKLDFFMFPLLLIFYILNYLVWSNLPPY